MSLDLDRIISDESLDTSDEDSSDPEASDRTGASQNISVDEDRVVQGLGQLVLALVNLLHELLEKQAIRRMESGSLSEEEIERLGQTLMKQSEEIDRLCEEFDLEPNDLNLDLGPLGDLV